MIESPPAHLPTGSISISFAARFLNDRWPHQRLAAAVVVSAVYDIRMGNAGAESGRAFLRGELGDLPFWLRASGVKNIDDVAGLLSRLAEDQAP